MSQFLPVWPEADPSIVAPIPEHEELRAIVKSLLDSQTNHDKIREAANSDLGWSTELWQLLNQDLDLGSMIVPESLGGAGFGMRDIVVVLEEAGAALLPEPVMMSLVVAPLALSMADDPKQTKDVLAGLCSGMAIGTLALNSAVDINGTKVSGVLNRVPNGTTADLVIFKHDNGLAFIQTSSAGVSTAELEVLDATRRQANIELNEVDFVPLVSAQKVEQVWTRLTRALTIALAAEHVGLIRNQLNTTVNYVMQREQFGRPIGSFQAIKHRLADVLVGLERARSAMVYAAALYDEDPDAALAAEVAAAVTKDVVIATVHEAVQLHGGIGFTWEHQAHFYLKRALGDEGLFGSARGNRTNIADLIGI